MEDFYTDIKKIVDNDIFFCNKNLETEEEFNKNNYMNYYNNLYLDEKYDDIYVESANERKYNNDFNINNYINFMINS